MRRQRWMLAVAVCAATLVTAVAPAGEPTSRPRHRLVSAGPVSNAAPRTFYFGVMGAVARPGVFVDPTAAPLLVDVVRRAGGLTEAATGAIRVVRHGKSGLHTFYSDRLDFRLAPGDVLIVDRQPARRTTARTFEYGRTEAAPGPDAGTVTVAFQNLVHRPVVLRMPQRQATVPHIVQLLGQRRDVANSVRVISATRRFGRDATTPETLTHETVLVFDPRAVDHNRLQQVLGERPFPKPIDTAEEVGRAALDDSVPDDERPSEPRPIDAVDETDADDGIAAIPNTIPEADPLPVEDDLSEPDTSAAVPTLIVADPTTKAETPASNPFESPLEPETPIEIATAPVPTPVDAPVTTTNVIEDTESDWNTVARVVDDERPTALENEPEQIATATPDRSVEFAVLLGSASAIVALCLVWRVFFWSSKPQKQSQSQPIVTDGRSMTTANTVPATSLDALIEGDLEVVEEPVVLASGIRFYGRASRATPLRVDAAHESADRPGVSNAPHFLQPPGSRDAAATVAPQPTPKRTVRFDQAHADVSSASGESVPRPRSRFDRALAAVQGGSDT